MNKKRETKEISLSRAIDGQTSKSNSFVPSKRVALKSCLLTASYSKYSYSLKFIAAKRDTMNNREEIELTPSTTNKEKQVLLNRKSKVRIISAAN